MQIPARPDLAAYDGIHLFHFGMSSCSQKVRIYLRLKGLDWTDHPVDLAKHESYKPDFLTINPRGMVPVLVLDGAVHIESNDILAVLEERFPQPCLFPAGSRAEIETLLAEEDGLHHDLRHLSFRFVHGRMENSKPAELLDAYRAAGSAGEAPDPKKAAEVAFYERLARTGLDDETCRTSAAKFRAAFDRFEARLSAQPFLLGPALTVIDIAWFVYAYRLVLGGYPLERLHPRVFAWFEARRATPGWEAEVAPPPPLAAKIAGVRERNGAEGTGLADVLDTSAR